jgi:hypothetical protein
MVTHKATVSAQTLVVLVRAIREDPVFVPRVTVATA